MVEDQTDLESKFYIHEATLWFEKYIPNSFTINFYQHISTSDLVIGKRIPKHPIQKCLILKEDLKPVGIADDHYVKFSKMIKLENHHVRIIYPDFVDNKFVIVHGSIRPATEEEVRQYNRTRII